jgi:hypothetical protein
MPATLWLTLLLSLFPVVPARARARIEARRATITAAVERAEREHGVPPGVLLVVGYGETHLGTDDGEGGNWGAPISRARRHTAGTPDHAARSLARSYRVCGSWRRAISRFRCGLCSPRNPGHQRDVALRVRLVRGLYDAASLPVPDGF